MMYGGTNWGALACPVTATSETRIIGNKFYETKNLALFTRVAEDLTVTDRIANSTDYSTNPAVIASELRNPETNGAFYVTIHSYSPSATKESFKLRVNTSMGNLTIPQKGGSIVLNGHQSKILVTDFAMGKYRLTYSTAEVLTYAIVDEKPVVVLWAGVGESIEYHVKGARKADHGRNKGHLRASHHKDRHGLLTNIASVKGMEVFDYDNGLRVVVADKPTAYLFWAPNLSDDPFAPVDKSGKLQDYCYYRLLADQMVSVGPRAIYCPQRPRRTWHLAPQGRYREQN
jgi:hypothetical protein